MVSSEEIDGERERDRIEEGVEDMETEGNEVRLEVEPRLGW